jgi:hypothetical protein
MLHTHRESRYDRVERRTMAGVLISESARVARIGGSGMIAGFVLVAVGRAVGSTIGFACVIVGIVVVVVAAGVVVAQTIERLMDGRQRRAMVAFSHRDGAEGGTRVLRRCDICARPKVDLGGVWVCAVCDHPKR